MTAIDRRLFVGGLVATTLVLPARAANGYRAYADAMLANPPRGAIIRPDLEQYLDLLAAEARVQARRLFLQWMDSAGHKKNMMNRWYAFVSTGAAQVNHHLYAVQVFWER